MPSSPGPPPSRTRCACGYACPKSPCRRPKAWLRGAEGIAGEPHPYGHSGVVANFAVEHAHEGRAWQWFQAEGGVLAWLPLSGRCVSMVWSTPDAHADELMRLSAEALAQRV